MCQIDKGLVGDKSAYSVNESDVYTEPNIRHLMTLESSLHGRQLVCKSKSRRNRLTKATRILITGIIISPLRYIMTKTTARVTDLFAE